LSYTFLSDPTFYESLLNADRDLASQARAAGCPYCGNKLHSAKYLRRPRGGLEHLALRFSFCCAEDGCRRRVTPPSLRFLSRRVYLGTMVILLSAMQNGLTPERLEHLVRTTGVSERTLGRWRAWWLKSFVGSRFWRSRRGRISPPVEAGLVPASLLERFAGDERERLVAMLRFLAPITGGQGLLGHAA